MRCFRVMTRLVGGVMVGVLLLVSVSTARAEAVGGETHNPAAEDVTQNGTAYCFARTLVIAGIVISAGNRCYNFYVVRTLAGTFLGFGPPGAPIVAPGQILRLNTPAGGQFRSRLYYMVPLQVPATTLPVNAAQFVALRIAGAPGRGLVFTVPVPGHGVEVGVAQR